MTLGGKTSLFADRVARPDRRILSSRLLPILVAAFLLAGCSARPPVSPTPSPSLLTLADLSKCDFVDGAGQPLPCESQARERPTEPFQMNATHVCVARTPMGEVEFRAYYPLAQDGIVLEVRFRDAREHWGLAWLSLDSTTRLWNWSASTQSYQVELPQAPPQGEVSILLYAGRLTNATPPLSGRTVEQLWVLNGGDPYPIHRVQAEGQAYYFVAVANITADGAILRYQMISSTFEGTDYAFTFSYDEFAFVRLAYDRTSPELGC